MTGYWTIRIKKDASVVVEGMNFEGKACELPDAVKNSLGSVVSEKKKQEWYAEEEVKQYAGA